MRTTVSSRELDRKTGEAKKAARTGPVFITNQGRTSHVLITIEAYKTLLSNDGNFAREQASDRTPTASTSA